MERLKLKIIIIYIINKGMTNTQIFTSFLLDFSLLTFQIYSPFQVSLSGNPYPIPLPLPIWGSSPIHSPTQASLPWHSPTLGLLPLIPTRSSSAIYAARALAAVVGAPVPGRSGGSGQLTLLLPLCSCKPSHLLQSFLQSLLLVPCSQSKGWL